MLTRVADLRFIYLCLTGPVDNLGRADMVTSLMLCNDYLTNPVSIWKLVDIIKGVFLSFKLITVNIIINAVNHKHPDRPSCSNLETGKWGFI
jgi:hypothetical protein